MAIVKVIPASDLVSDFTTKYNNTCDKIVVSASTSGQNIVVTKFDGSTNTLTGAYMFRKGDPAAQDSVCLNDQGGFNVATGLGSAVLAGINNQATGIYSVSVGGNFNASAAFGGDIVLGGAFNRTTGISSAVVCGTQNTATTSASAIVGGSGNTTTALYAVALGGQSITASKANTVHVNNLSIDRGVIYVQTGTSRMSGLVTLVNGQAFVSNTLVTTATMIMLTHQSSAGTLGHLFVSGRTAGTSFSIGSSSATDTSKVSYLMIEPY